MRILFVDPVCPKPYDPQVLATEPLGGTEATVVRVAEALCDKIGFKDVVVKQHNRTHEFFGVADYLPFGAEIKQPTHVIVLRAPMALYQARKQFPNAKLYLWCHDIFSGPGWADGFKALVDTQTVPVVVSDWHKMQMYDAMKQLGCSHLSIPSRRIYNPIADDLVPDDTKHDVNSLVYFSSPHKGLDRTLEVFAQFQEFEDLRDMKLYIANPGYFPDKDVAGMRNVVNLGALSHSQIIQKVRESLAVFHLNAVFPETFGLVGAEANAVATPWLSSRLGATPEVADHPSELIDVMDNEKVIKRIQEWRKGRPKVRANPAFRLKKIVAEWVEFLSL